MLTNILSVFQTARRKRGPPSSKLQTDNVTIKRQKKNTPKSNLKPRLEAEKGIFCIFCDELFVEPPSEEWIECAKCRRWCHEECADTENVDIENNFVCGVC